MRYRLLLAVAASVAAADLLTKGIASALSRTYFAISLPGNWTLYPVHNNGIIGGFGAGTIAPDVMAAVAAVQIMVLIFLDRHDRRRLEAVAVGLVLGAYAGNIGESRLTGHVVDWIHPPHLPVAFDLADVACLCGQLLLIALMALDRFRRVAVAQ